MEKEKQFKPFIPADKVTPELTFTSIIVGVILAVIFGAANAYLGLRVGMTVSASIPAAVISMGVLRVILRRDSILENNMVQTIGSAGESVAAGAIFTLPALFMWAQEWGTKRPSLMIISLIALCGGVLGILFMIPLRKALIVKEHGVLPYPEGCACAEVLLAGETGGSKASIVFAGLGIAALYKFIADGLKLFPSEIHYEIPSYGSGVGTDVLPALVSIGYICGAKVSSYLLAGGVLSWLVLIPLIKLFGGSSTMFPSTEPISNMDSFSVWSSYIRYIGAGAVATGGIISLIKSLPLIVDTFGKTFKDLKPEKGNDNIKSNLRTDQDMSVKVLITLIVICVLVMAFVPSIPVNVFGALIIVAFGFFFSTVSSRLVGLVGSSNNPVSGMAIATLLISTLILKVSGASGQDGMVAAIVIGSVICIIAAIAGDTSQDLKTGYILGATPKKQQYGELVGVVFSAIAIGGVLYLLSAAWGYGSPELPAPQAMLMKMIVEGVMQGDLPWTLVFIGAFIAIIVEILNIPVLPFCVGLYLPIHLSLGIMVGGLVRLFFEKKKMKSEEERKEVVNRGILYTSGMIAGEGLIGILLAVFAVIPMGANSAGKSINLGNILDLSSKNISIGNVGGFIFFALLILSLILFAVKKPKTKIN